MLYRLWDAPTIDKYVIVPGGHWYEDQLWVERQNLCVYRTRWGVPRVPLSSRRASSGTSQCPQRSASACSAVRAAASEEEAIHRENVAGRRRCASPSQSALSLACDRFQTADAVACRRIFLSYLLYDVAHVIAEARQLPRSPYLNAPPQLFATTPASSGSV